LEGTSRSAAAGSRPLASDGQVRETPKARLFFDEDEESPLVVRVLTPTGAPVTGFRARLVGAGSALTVETFSPSGEVALPESKLAAARAAPAGAGPMLEVWNAVDREGTSLELAPARRGPLTGHERVVEVRLEPCPVFEGVFVASDSSFLRSVEVEWRRKPPAEAASGPGVPGEDVPEPPLAENAPFEELATKVSVGPSGRFRLPYASPGVHELVVHVPREYVPVPARDVLPGDPPLEIRLRRSVTARISVLGPDDVPQVGFLVKVLTMDGDGTVVSSAFTAEDGVSVVERLDLERRYRLVVEPTGLHRSESASSRPLAGRVVEAWAPADTTVRLRAGHVVAGTVRDATDLPVAGHTVELRTAIGVEMTWTEADGSFRFEGVASGPACLGLDDGPDHPAGFERLRDSLRTPPGGGGRPRPAPSPDWTDVDVVGDVRGVTLRTRTLATTLLLPPTDGGVRLHLTRRTEDGWETMERESRFVEGGARPHTTVSLAPGRRYAAWMRPTETTYAYAEFTPEGGTVTLAPKEGRSIHGRVLDLPTGARVEISLVDDRLRRIGGIKPDARGRFAVHGLPDSTWSTRALCWDAERKLFHAEADVATGNTVELRLAPWEPLDR
jgi:hypothetical protein